MSKSKQQVDDCGYNDSQKHTVVDMRGKCFCSDSNFVTNFQPVRGRFADVMVLNDIIEQAAGRQSRASEKAGKCNLFYFESYLYKLYW